MSETKMWGGRFAAKTAASVEDYTSSQQYDRALYAEDISGSIAHAHMMAKQGVLTAEEAEILVNGLNSVREEIESGVFVWKKELEDVHMNIEARLTEIVGPLGGKLHTGRSRNDQVALDFRLHVTRRMREWQHLLAHLVESIVARADENRSVILPGCTHMQPAQPVSLAHHLLAYAQMFRRDSERAADCEKRANVSPLGAAALAGTTYAFEPSAVAEELGMNGVFANSMDAVSDRDFVVEAVFTGSMVMAHLSRLCEEIILWSNPAFGFIKLPDAFATGSSIMPQKKNPDVAELMRGKTGRVYGALNTLMTLIKGLPLAYNRDMQEDKEPFFDADRTVRASVSIMADMMAELGFDAERMRAACARGYLNATELADYLASKGLPFRQAHHVTGNAVGYAEKQGKGLEDLTLEELREFSELIEADVFEALAYETAVARRETSGGTGPNSVSRQISDLREWLGQYA
ncbi:argininosuccinate lyase [Desulfobaculum bizertense]|uniref:argininosuccinate lyase n=1 Tax=Desulfobaculum bizertense TaxID=376490 RepID=UPI001F26048A|nr:argininosuccinate lyase [Desulfobaculum bizertense]UIJ38062.1 argininosuccinate lyase [Desulfobaculum bizertense]